MIFKNPIISMINLYAIIPKVDKDIPESKTSSYRLHLWYLRIWTKDDNEALI